MNCRQALRERLARAEKMAQIGAAEMPASVAAAIFIKRLKIFGEFGFGDLQRFVKFFILIF